MKIKTIAAACALAALAANAAAQTYVGIGAGASHGCTSYGMASGCGTTDASAKALVGYGFAGTDFALEGMVMHLGTLKVDSIDGSVRTDGNLVGVAGAWRPQFGGGWGGVLRAGAAYGSIKTRYSVVQLGTPISTASGSTSRDSLLPTLGAGATYALTPNIRLAADWDYARLRALPGGRSGENFNTFTVGATFGF